MGTWEGRNEKLLTKIDKESSLVDKRFEISNRDLVSDMKKLLLLEHHLSITEHSHGGI